jgi:hypothetical protein
MAAAEPVLMRSRRVTPAADLDCMQLSPLPQIPRVQSLERLAAQQLVDGLNSRDPFIGKPATSQ